MGNALDRARADLEAGRAWKARDRLVGLLVHRHDSEVIDLLASVYFRMEDYPAAGALWFAIGRDDEQAQLCLQAWRERFGDDGARWGSIPGPIRGGSEEEHLLALKREALGASGQRPGGGGEVFVEKWWEPIVFGGGAILVVLVVLAFFVIGVWTVLRWAWT